MAFALSALLAVVAAAEPQLTAESRELIGTVVTVTLVAPPGPATRAAIDAAFAEFDVVARDMNEWVEASPLGRVNAGAGLPTGVEAPPALCEAVRGALGGAELTGGLFDPTWAALRGLWRFTPDHTGSPPAEAALRERCGLVAWRAVRLAPLQDGRCRIALPRAGMALGLGGYAKGVGVDRAVARLRALGYRDFAVKAGGDLYAAGTRGGRPWVIGVRDPRGGPDDVIALVSVSDEAFSTSGDYERWFEHQGRRYHHLIDPRTCAPATASRAATVLAATATQAEVLTKAAFIAGWRQGLPLVERAGGAALVVDASGKIHLTEALAARTRLTGPGEPGPVRPGPEAARKAE